MVSRALLLKLADSPRVERFVKRNAMASGLARRFVAGETMEHTVAAVRSLNEKGITASLDYLGENVTRLEEATASRDYYFRLLDFISHQQLDSNVSCKLTQLGLDVGEDVAFENMRAILERAAGYDQFVRIDMEGSAYTEPTLRLFYRLFEDHKNVGAVIQSYLYRSEDDVARLIDANARVRLVKGAYREPVEIAYQRTSEVESSFMRLAESLLDRGNYPAIATHDEKLVSGTISYSRLKGIVPDKFEFQMLYGIRRERQLELRRAGYRVRVYVPFGTQWYGYLMRRLAERPGNLWFFVKNLFRR